MIYSLINYHNLKMLLTLLLVILGTQTSKTQQPASESVDVVLLIDSSNTLGRQGFLSLKNYVNRMINNLPIGPNKYHLALVQYSDDIHVEFQLDDFRGKNPMLNHVKKIFSFHGGPLRTGNAIQKIHKTIFKAPRRDRHQVLIVTTSGVSQDNVEGPATLMRKDGIKIIALGMQSASQQELQSMATHPFSYHFDTLKDFQKFSSNILSVIESAVAIDESLVSSTAIPPSTTYAHSIPIKVVDCSEDLIADVVFVVDEAVSPTNSEYIVSFIQNTTTSLDVQKSCIRIGIVTYSNEPRVLSQLNTETEIKDLVFKIKSFSPREGKAKLGAALNLTREIIFTESAGSRKTEGAEQIATIITHRPSEDSVTEASSLLLQKGVTVFAISIEGANITQLEGVVSYPPNRNIIKVDHFSNLADKSKIFKKKLFKHIHMFFAQAERTEEFRSGCMETEKADIYFLVDGSSSISPSNFIKMKTFLKEVIKLFTIGPDHVRFGVVQFGTLYQTEFELDKYTKISHVEKAINNIIQMGVDTYTGAAIQSMQPLFEKAKKQRDGEVPSYLIVLTDGEAHDNVLEPSKMLRKSAVNIYAIGVKPANITQLNEIADSKSKVYYVEQFDSLKNIKNEIVRDICFEKACEKMKADVMFLVDSSGSISHQDFEKMKKFMQELIDKCSVGQDEVQFGVVQFSSTNKEEFQLNSSKDYIINAIGNMAQMQQNTYTGKALQFVSDYFKPAKGARPSVNKILILLTDGEAHDDVREPASALRKEGVIIYSIGITGANVTQLVEISGAPKKMFYLKDYDVLKYIENDIVFRICSPYNECKRINRLDLVFVIDSSSSIGETNYTLMNNFIIGIVNKSDVGKDHVQFGAVKYSNNPEIMFKLNTYNKRSDIIKFIQDNTLLKGDTYTAKALQLSKGLLTKENGSRIHQGVPQVLMVITDGESHDKAILDSTSNELRKKGTIIYAIGIKDANREELEIMAGSKDYWFYMPSFEGLESITTNLSNQLCIDSRPECDIEAELVILTDSRSIPDKELKGVKDFVINLLKSIINKDNILVGMAQFSNTLQEVFQLGAYQNLPELYSKITNMSLITGDSTLIGRALREVKTFFKTSKQRVARSINQKLLIFTDGRSDDEFPQAAKDLRDEGVEIHAVAVGNVTDSKLLQITNSPSRKYKVDHYSDLKTLVNHVNKEICKETTEATCFVDIIIGFDISSQKPGNNLFSKQQHLESHLPGIIKALTSLSSTSCSKGKKVQFSVTISVENTDKPFWAKFHHVDDTNIVTELRNVIVNRPSHLNINFLDAIWNLMKNVTDIENRNTVLLLFSDGLDDNIIALGQKSEEFRIQGLDGLITVSLEGAKYIDQLQHIEFGKGFGYNTQLSVDTENIAMRLFQYVDQIAERKCCCIFCRCEGEEGPRGERREKGHKGTPGFVGHPGYPGNDGDPGPRGIPGIQGKQGDIGECGTRGRKGQRGLNGKRGEDGADGVDGIHGEEGSLGFPGLKGEKGDPGEMGNTGPKGPPGDLGPKSFQGDRGEPGQDNNVRGAKGFKGLSGRMGERGLKGSDGSAGSPGNKGAEGNPGPLGPKGEEGNPGTDGLQGDQGVQGSLGTTGILGVKGEKGQPGNHGHLGDIGNEGPKGNQGKLGSRGNKGESGEPGEKGKKGSLGQRGMQGEEGTVGFGNIGRKGRKGIEGFPGDFGNQGKRGDMGNPGKPGLKGKRGRMAPGLVGDDGELGTWGYPGHLGPKGAKGQSFYSPCELIEYVQKHSKIPKCPAYPTELVFALDISQDITLQMFEQMKKIVTETVNQTNIRESNCPVGARVAVVSYSSNTNYLIRFTDFQSKNKLLQELNRLSLQRTTNRRDIGGSMKFVARHIFKRTLQGANVRKVAVFFSNGESDHPDSIGTAVLEFSALGIQPAVITFKNIPEITQAFEMDSTGLFQVIHLHQKSDLSALKKLQMCVICYDKCKPDESCFRTPPFKPEAYMDAAFILENTRKISTTGFEELKHFLSRALDSFKISTNPKTSLIGDRIAIVSHAPLNFQFQKEWKLPVKVEFDLVTYESKRQMKRHIEKSFEKLNGEAALGHAIEWTINHIFSEGLNQREKKAIFIISVGETSHWDKEVLSDAALRAKCKGYAVFVLSIGPEYDYIELMELASFPLEHHIVQLGRIHKAELEYAVKFLQPLIHLLKNEIHIYPHPELKRICAKISHQKPSTPFDKTPPNKIHLIDENGSAFPEYLQSDSLFPEKMVSNAYPSIVPWYRVSTSYSTPI
ncbi:collagen alpha-6(VI) chain-like [Pantherophis guttatus]|uniref:Collagen alpha-6(VI) chain-like n=1 Tax=Pantherophis guttatus TaxID=94885 RepID=A0ABM3Z0I5_PANGU|nr:collagen alpha-6(VI) chain-like [Pantherophis guttatus]